MLFYIIFKCTLLPAAAPEDGRARDDEKQREGAEAVARRVERRRADISMCFDVIISTNECLIEKMRENRSFKGREAARVFSPIENRSIVPIPSVRPSFPKNHSPIEDYTSII